MEEVKRPAVARGRTQDTTGLNHQCSATGPPVQYEGRCFEQSNCIFAQYRASKYSVKLLYQMVEHHAIPSGIAGLITYLAQMYGVENSLGVGQLRLNACTKCYVYSQLMSA